MFKNKSNLKFIIGVVIVVILILLAVWVGFLIAAAHSNDPAGPSPYTAVYLTSGDIYFGKLHWWPQPYLTDVLYLERGTGANGQTQLGIGSLSTASWGPTDEIHLDARQILYWTPLRNNSQLIPLLENPASLNQAAATSAGVPSQNPTNASSSL